MNNDDRDKAVDKHAGRSPGGSGHDGDGGDVREYLARLEEKVSAIKERMATKKDVADLKVWILPGVTGGMAFAAMIAATVSKAFF